MRALLSVILLVSTCASWLSAQTTQPTTQPATQPSVSIENWQSLKEGMTLDEATAIMGKPSQVDDLQKTAFRLSPGEDSFLVRHRSKLSQRAVWYVNKVGQSPNPNDIWFTAYFARSDGKLVGKLSNPPGNR